MSPALASSIGFSALMGASCARLAERKNRSVAAWFVFGVLAVFAPLGAIAASSPVPSAEAAFLLDVLFGLIPLFALSRLPRLPDEEWQP